VIRYLGSALTLLEVALLTMLALRSAAAITPVNDVARESVDLIEVNSTYDEYGKFIFRQIIFWDFEHYTALNGAAGYRYQVVCWRMLKDDSQLPQRDHASRRYFVRWQDGNIARHVSAKEFRETWSQYDPELLEREILPKEKRRELRGAP
jgi:hypothetical protein